MQTPTEEDSPKLPQEEELQGSKRPSWLCDWAVFMRQAAMEKLDDGPLPVLFRPWIMTAEHRAAMFKSVAAVKQKQKKEHSEHLVRSKESHTGK